MGTTLDQDERIVRDGFWDKVRRTLGRVPFLQDAVAAYYCVLDRETPAHVRAILIGALAYFVIPSDLIPDITPVLGFTDDAAVFWAAFSAVKPHITDKHRRAAARALHNATPDAAAPEADDMVT